MTLIDASTSPRVETSSGNRFLLMAKCRGDGREPSQRVQHAVVAVLWCWARDAYHRTKHRPQQHQEPYCLRLRLLFYHLGRPIKGYWDTKTTRYTTTWLVARPETGLIISQSTWTRPSRITGHPWACTSSKIARRGRRETLFIRTC